MVRSQSEEGQPHSTAVAAEKKVRGWPDKDQSVAIGDREWRVKELIDRVERELQR